MRSWILVVTIFATQVEPGAAPTNAPPLATEYKLTGWVLQKDTRSVFLIRHEPNNQSRQIQLREGEKFQELEILKINPEKRSVRVRYDGVEGDMNFDTHGIRPIRTVEDQGKEFVQIHRKFVNDHVRAHEARQRAQSPSTRTNSSSVLKTP